MNSDCTTGNYSISNIITGSLYIGDIITININFINQIKISDRLNVLLLDKSAGIKICDGQISLYDNYDDNINIVKANVVQNFTIQQQHPELQLILTYINQQTYSNPFYLSSIELRIIRQSSITIAPQGIHIQVDSSKYLRIDSQNGYKIQSAQVVPQYLQAKAKTNKFIVDNNPKNGAQPYMQLFLGNKGHQYLSGDNNSIQISGSNFLLSSSGQLFINGNSGLTSQHNQLLNIQGGSQQLLQYYHFSQQQYLQILQLINYSPPPTMPLFTYFHIGSGSVSPSANLILQQGQNIGNAAYFK